MSNKETGGPAFPTSVDNYEDMEPAGDGMTMRDYFAAKAMQGLMGRSWDINKFTAEELFAQWSASAYLVADAMLKARNE